MGIFTVDGLFFIFHIFFSILLFVHHNHAMRSVRIWIWYVNVELKKKTFSSKKTKIKKLLESRQAKNSLSWTNVKNCIRIRAQRNLIL